ncbi:MAG: branched-chain amino acid aminotransferase [Spirochaetes bacterium]|nr:branched-chain amino acid aminotransferase [Spirochaetota bacterium]MBN2769084.1 branched-chain amino acid aminotransferase [Spirochaetota bacterium]
MSVVKADLDWSNLPFTYVKTDKNVRYHYKDGSWGAPEICEEDMLSINIAAPALHYGQQGFEGLKAFETRDGRVVCFRPDENAKRMNRTNSRINMPEIPEEIFISAVETVIRENIRFVPPYGTGASLYLRPLMIGVGPKVGLGPADEYIFLVFATPVGPYYKGGFKPVDAVIVEGFDRAAPHGVGDCKVGGNYAAGLPGSKFVKEQGCAVGLYLDPQHNRYIDEFSTSNFIGIKDSSYITPKSPSILPSITNKSLATIAQDMGMLVESRQVEIGEVEGFDEVGAVGTAAVITPVHSIKYGDKILTFGEKDSAGPVLTKLYETLTKIQTGEVEDKHRWLLEIL